MVPHVVRTPSTITLPTDLVSTVFVESAQVRSPADESVFDDALP